MRGHGSFKGGWVSVQCATIKLWMHVGGCYVWNSMWVAWVWVGVEKKGKINWHQHATCWQMGLLYQPIRMHAFVKLIVRIPSVHLLFKAPGIRIPCLQLSGILNGGNIQNVINLTQRPALLWSSFLVQPYNGLVQFNQSQLLNCQLTRLQSKGRPVMPLIL